jgi:RecB family endonuclease NucS
MGDRKGYRRSVLLQVNEEREIVDRQGAFRNAGRLDLLVKDRLGNFIVYELKKGAARPAALEQIKGYMKACEKKHRVRAKMIRGVILARDAEPGLLKVLRKAPKVKFKKYYFSIEMKDEME